MFGLIAKEEINVLRQAIELMDTSGKHNVKPATLDWQSPQKNFLSPHCNTPSQNVRTESNKEKKKKKDLNIFLVKVYPMLWEYANRDT